MAKMKSEVAAANAARLRELASAAHAELHLQGTRDDGAPVSCAQAFATCSGAMRIFPEPTPKSKS
jgi:hypothetical protein